MDQSKIIFFNKKQKPEVFKFVVFKCLELALEKLDINCNLGSDKIKIEKHFKKMKKADLVKLCANEDELVDILKNKIFNQ